MAKNDKNSEKKREWRKVAQKVMRDATEREVKARFNGEASFNYRWEHVTAVVTLALKLAHLTGADEEVVEAAAWLHDVRKETGSKHPIEGAKFARELLTKTDFPPEKVQRVAQAIEDHMGLWRDTPLTNLESQVLWDADKLAKIGLTAAFHWTGLNLAGNKLQTIEDLIQKGKSAEWQVKTVASMHTAPARQAAEARLAAFNQLWQSLEQELKGEDLSL